MDRRSHLAIGLTLGALGLVEAALFHIFLRDLVATILAAFVGLAVIARTLLDWKDRPNA